MSLALWSLIVWSSVLFLFPPTVGILLRFDRPPSEAFVKQLRREVEYIFEPSGLLLRWETVRRRTPGVYDRILIVQMRGNCSSQFSVDLGPPEPGLALGRTVVNDGEVIPFSIVDCDQVARVVAHAARSLPARLLVSNMYARLAGRVLVHEMLHALLGSTGHDPAGFARSPIQAGDLTTMPRLTPAQLTALQRLGRPTPGVSVANK